MAKKQKEVTTLDVQIAEFIRNHKLSGTATDEEINSTLIVPFSLDADGIDNLFQRRVFRLPIRMEIQVSVYWQQKRKKRICPMRSC